MAALRVGRGTDDGVQVGPLVDETSRDSVSSLVDDAVAGGAKVLAGGHPIGDRGWFYAPTVLTDVPEGAALLREEIFGPVAPVTTFSSVADAVRLANDTQYGLVAYAYTESLRTALRLAEELDTGMIGINQGAVSNPAAPFGGVKHSGFGREGGPEGIEEYLETRYVGIRP
jgi:succinate-semialdehyde dehydrogenase/glutarate-semialdehyde dehydrogenase